MQINLCFGCMEQTVSYPCPHCGYQPRAGQPYELPPGTILNGKYLIGKVLGQGGFGITYIGWDLALSRKVAIKEYFPATYVSRDSSLSTRLQWYPTSQAQDARLRGKELFLKEARKMTRVQSIPQVVYVLNLFEENDTAYIVMNYVPGETLASRIRKTGPLSWQAARDLLLPVADALEQVHHAGLIHRDLSPDNLMIHPDGTVWILDLGAARDLKLRNAATSMQVAKGGYSPLEQYVQGSPTGAWTDVYSMAATVYFVLTGTVPPSAVERIDRDTLRWDLPGLKKVPAPVLHALRKGMALQAADRFQTMDSFTASLRSRSIRLSPKLLAGAATALAGIALLAAFGGKPAKEEPKPAKPTVSSTVPVQAAPEEDAPAEADFPWGSNVLTASVIPEPYEYHANKAPVFNSRITREQILSVTFLDTLEGVSADAWDVSAARDSSVMAWTRPNGTVSTYDENYQTVKTDAYDLYIAAEDGINGKYCAHLFEGYSNLKTVDFNNCFHTNLCENMESMFDGCGSLTGLELEELNTGRVRSMARLFQGCAFKEIDVSSLDTSCVTDMSHMFYSCDNLTSLDLRNFDTSRVVNMTDMFCLSSKLVELDISSFDTSSVTDMSFMFSFTGLTELDLRHFDTSKVTTLSYMFSNSSSLKTLDVRGWDTSKVNRMSGCFSGCRNLETIQGILDWDTSSVDYYDSFMDEGRTINGKPWKSLFE